MTPDGGLCHGPGCDQPQTVPFWCSEACQRRWDERWGKRLPDDLLTPSPMTTAGGYTAPAPRPVFTMDELAHYYRLLAPVEPPEPVKLTREQFEELREASPTYPDYARPSTFGDIPVVLVDSVEESTVYLTQLARYSHAAETNRRGWLSRVLGRMFGKDQT